MNSMDMPVLRPKPLAVDRMQFEARLRSSRSATTCAERRRQPSGSGEPGRPLRQPHGLIGTVHEVCDRLDERWPQPRALRTSCTPAAPLLTRGAHKLTRLATRYSPSQRITKQPAPVAK
jgi:hypothetical protein